MASLSASANVGNFDNETLSSSDAFTGGSIQVSLSKYRLLHCSHKPLSHSFLQAARRVPTAPSWNWLSPTESRNQGGQLPLLLASISVLASHVLGTTSLEAVLTALTGRANEYLAI